MEPEYTEEEPGFWSKVVELIEFIAVVAAILVVIRFFVAEPHKVSGHSMDNNFHDGDYIITNKLSLKTATPERGEVVILQNPRNLDQVFIKRVIGLPGDKVTLKNGQVFINNQLLNEPYLPTGLKTNGGLFLAEGSDHLVPQGYYFVMGDNRSGSSDSREWGPVQSDLLVGQAWLRYWPPQKFNLIKIAQASQ